MVQPIPKRIKKRDGEEKKKKVMKCSYLED